MPIDWSSIYREVYPDVVRFLHRKVWDEERAQDLAQEVFVRALDQTPDNPRAWLFTVASNLARDEARAAVRKKRHLELLKGEAELRQETSVRSASEAIERSEQMERVKQALDKLTERDRMVLLLWDAGLSYDVIARETGLSRGAIGTTLARARSRLVEAYEGLEGGNVARG